MIAASTCERDALKLRYRGKSQEVQGSVRYDKKKFTIALVGKAETTTNNRNLGSQEICGSMDLHGR